MDNSLGEAYFRIFSADCGGIINKLRDTGIIVRNMRISNENIVTGRVDWYNLDELKEFVNENKAMLEITEKKGIVFSAARYKKRIGIAVGLLLAVLIVFYFSNIVLKIEVYGNESVSDEHIISVLADYGIKIGTFIPSLDLRASEQKIITALDDLDWIGLRSSGCRILVDVSEISEKPDMIPRNTPCNIVAACDAQIVDIRNVYMGMLIPMLYDGVKKGDLLISGTVDGKLDHDYYVHAMGEIIGRYDRSVTFEQPYSDSIINYGEPKTRTSLYLFGLRIPLYLNISEKFDYEYSEETSYAELFGLSLPVGTVKARLKPYTTDEVEYSPEQAEIILEEKIKTYEINFLGGDEIKVIDKQTQFYETSDGIGVTVRYTLESNIGVEREILAKMQ